jgi:hypothetical protein
MQASLELLPLIANNIPRLCLEGSISVYLGKPGFLQMMRFFLPGRNVEN